MAEHGRRQKYLKKEKRRRENEKNEKMKK